MVEELVNGAVARTYTYGLQRISQYQLVSNTWAASFYGYDGGGNVRMLTDVNKNVTDTYDYDAFGNEFTVSGGSSTPNNYLYRGEQYDPDLGLYYLRARYYNPITGRFMSRDPEDGKIKDPATLHKYLYTGGDPVNRIDPRGREMFEVALEDTWIETSESIAIKIVMTSICTAYVDLAADLLELEHDARDIGLGVGGAGCGLIMGW